MKLAEKLILNVLDQKRSVRRLILCIIDSILVSVSFLVSYFLIHDQITLKIFDFIYFIFTLNLVSIPTYIVLGKYKGITRYSNSANLYSLAFKNIIITLIFSVIISKFSPEFFNFKFWIIFWLIFTVFIGSINFIIRDLLQKITYDYSPKTNVAIYGASLKGAQLASAIKIDSNYKLVAFVDDSLGLSGRNIGNVPIYNSRNFFKVHRKIKKIFLSESDLLSNENKIELIDKFSKYGIKVLQSPSFEYANYKKDVSTYRPIQIEDLLSRECVYPDENLIRKIIKERTICITGAGGSIGSELCRQVLNFKPRKLILLEMSEENLYKIKSELSNFELKNIQLIYFLGSATNKKLLQNIFRKYKVQIVFHAAAYKHVPIVEENPLSGIFNNVISTYSVCEIALKENLEQVILISTDKAVRPTNVMGASKRLAELVVQSFSSKSKTTIFSMVRFGNVLGSSGSVVPLFQKQISSGGPVTITHKDVTRYFMTIKEAAQLVIQAAALSNGGEVFLLDMGKPIKIYDLAEKMIKLSGLKIFSDENPDGDISIVTSGLRPGEKLYEELLIDGKAQSTSHPLIFKANESFQFGEEIIQEIKNLEYLLINNKEDESLTILKKMVPEWTSS